MPKHDSYTICKNCYKLVKYYKHKTPFTKKTDGSRFYIYFCSNKCRKTFLNRTDVGLYLLDKNWENRIAKIYSNSSLEAFKQLWKMINKQ